MLWIFPGCWLLCRWNSSTETAGLIGGAARGGGEDPAWRPGRGRGLKILELDFLVRVVFLTMVVLDRSKDGDCKPAELSLDVPGRDGGALGDERRVAGWLGLGRGSRGRRQDGWGISGVPDCRV